MKIPRTLEEEAEYEEIASAASLYYLERLTQEQVAKELKISQSKVVRLLDRARNEEIAQTFINLPPLHKSQSELENYVKERGVHTVSLVPSGAGKNISFLGMGGARVLLATLLSIEEETIRIVMSCGETLGAVIDCFLKLRTAEPDAFEKLKRKKLELYPAALYADSRLVEGIYPHTLVSVCWVMMKRYKDDFPNIEGYVPNLPPDFYKRDFKEKQEYLEYHGINGIIDRAKEAHVFLLGIGTITNETYRGIKKEIGVYVDEEKFCMESNFIPMTEDGTQHEDFAKNLVGINIEDFRDIMKRTDRYVIAVAGGDKFAAIEAALQMPYFNVLVTDRGVARYLLDKWTK